MQNNADTTTYAVVVNHEEQYSIWPETKALPAGWNKVEIPAAWLQAHNGQKPNCAAGDKEVCLAYIDSVWTDMRPLSLRKKHAELSR